MRRYPAEICGVLLAVLVAVWYNGFEIERGVVSMYEELLRAIQRVGKDWEIVRFDTVLLKGRLQGLLNASLVLMHNGMITPTEMQNLRDEAREILNTAWLKTHESSI